MNPIRFTIYGEPASKANSRKLVAFGKRPAIIKSDKARDYEDAAILQIPKAARLALECDVRITIRIYYATKRPDLDESVILDVLQHRWKTRGKGPNKKRELVQCGVYVNDRQVKEKHVFHSIDPVNPRAEIEIEPISDVTRELFNMDVAVAAGKVAFKMMNEEMRKNEAKLSGVVFMNTLGDEK